MQRGTENRKLNKDFIEIADQLELNLKEAFLAEDYFSSAEADDSLLNGIRPRAFFYSRKSQQIIAEARLLYSLSGGGLASPDAGKRWLKFLWACGKSSAAYIETLPADSHKNRDRVFSFRCETLGKAEAAAMEAESLPCYTSLYNSFYKNLDALAAEDPGILQKACTLLAHTAAAPAPELLLFELCLLHGASDSKTISDILLKRILKLIGSLWNFSPYALRHLSDFFSSGDPAAFPEYVRGSRIRVLQPEEMIKYRIVSGAAAVLALTDRRGLCALKALATLSSENAIAGAAEALNAAGKGISDLDRILTALGYDPVLIMACWFPSKKSFTWEGGKLKEELLSRYGNPRSAWRFESYFGLQVEKGMANAMGIPCHNETAAYRQEIRQETMALMTSFFSGDEWDQLGNFAADDRPLDWFENWLEEFTIQEDRLQFNTTLHHLSHGDPHSLCDCLTRYRLILGPDLFFCKCVLIFSCCTDCAFLLWENTFEPETGLRNGMKQTAEELLASGLSRRNLFRLISRWDRISNPGQGTPEALFNVVMDLFCSEADTDLFSELLLSARAARPEQKLAAVCLSRQYMENGNSKALETLLRAAGTEDDSLLDFLTALYSAHPEWHEYYAGLIQSQEKEIRKRWLEIIGKLDPVPFRAELEQALKKEKDRKTADMIAALLKRSITVENTEHSADELTALLTMGGRTKKVRWLLDQTLPPVRTAEDENQTVSEDLLAALFLSYADMEKPEISPVTAVLAGRMNAADLKNLAEAGLKLWLEAGMPVSEKWILTFSAATCGGAVAGLLIPFLSEWHEAGRYAIIHTCMKALIVSSDPAALAVVDMISRTHQRSQVRRAAAEALENAAVTLGITDEELADRIIPDLGFGRNGIRLFDYGTRTFTVRFTPAAVLKITDETGRILKNLPAPGKNDDPVKASAAAGTFKDLKKELRQVLSVQKSRLNDALFSGRSWTAAKWKQLFMNHPLMHPFAVSLIWGAYEDGVLKQSFRCLEDGSFTTASEEDYELPENATVSLIHPVDLSEEELAAWTEQLKDYEIVQSIPQLGRPVFRVPEANRAAYISNAFSGRTVNSCALSRKLEKAGWSAGELLAHGMYFCFKRYCNRYEVCALLNITGISVCPAYEDMVTVQELQFNLRDMDRTFSEIPKEERSSWLCRLGDVPARYYSEVFYELDSVISGFAGTPEAAGASDSGAASETAGSPDPNIIYRGGYT